MPTFSARWQEQGVPVTQGPGRGAMNGFNGIGLKPPQQQWTIAGVTRDANGAALPSCNMELFFTLTDVAAIRFYVSDAVTGAFKFYVAPNFTYYAVAYKAGSPDVAGTGLNTLTGV